MRHWIGALLAFTLANLGATQAFAQNGRWLRAETAGFVVYGAASERAVLGLAEQLEVFDGLLRRMTDAPAERSPTKLEVYLVSDDQFAEIFPQMSNSIAGLYSARVDQIAAFAVQRDGGDNDTLFHEYAHHFMFQHFANAYPAWYVEGFAEFVAPTILGTERITMGRSREGRFYTLRNDRWMPIEQLITASPWRLSSEDRQMFYAQSWLLTHYIFLTPGKTAQFQAYLRALRLGQEPIEAFQAGFGVTPQAMMTELRRYYRSSPNALALTRPAQVDLSRTRVTRLPASADQLLTAYTRLRYGVPNSDAPAVLARVRSIAGSAPSDRFALVTLALAEIRHGERERARAVLTPYLETQPEDVEALYLMGLSHLEDADATEGAARETAQTQARRYFGRAFRRDSNHVPSLYRYAQTYDGVSMDQATWENYLNVMLLAHQLAPQIDEIGINAASVLISHNRHAEAIPMLRAIAFDPHGGGNTNVARQMMERAQAEMESAD